MFNETFVRICGEDSALVGLNLVISPISVAVATWRVVCGVHGIAVGVADTGFSRIRTLDTHGVLFDQGRKRTVQRSLHCVVESSTPCTHINVSVGRISAVKRRVLFRLVSNITCVYS